MFVFLVYSLIRLRKITKKRAHSQLFPPGGVPAETEQRPVGRPAEEHAEEAFEERRELNALRHKMHKAVEEEDFETAIELRDMIRKMENK